MNPLEYWQKQHQKYLAYGWITKPTIFAKQIIKFLPKNGKIIELGAGQGQDSRFFSKYNYQVTSTDFTQSAIDISQKRSKDLKINYKNIDLSRPLPFGDSSFEIVYSHLSLHYFDNIFTNKLFDEIYRILKNGGILATLVNTINDPEVSESKKIEEEYFLSPVGIKKRFFSLESFHELIDKKYEIIILDENGETYKDRIKNLIRFVGKKI